VRGSGQTGVTVWPNSRQLPLSAGRIPSPTASGGITPVSHHRMSIVGSELGDPVLKIRGPSYLTMISKDMQPPFYFSRPLLKL